MPRYERSAYYAPDPWAVMTPRGGTYFYTDAAERLALVKEITDRAWLQDMLTNPSTQKAVRAAIERRLRKLP